MTNTSLVGKNADIDWGYGNTRKNSTIPQNTENVKIINVWRNCYDEELCHTDKITVPVLTARLINIQ